MYEYWSQVADFPDYQVSNLGRVRRITYYRVWKKPHRGAKHIHVHGSKWQVLIQGKYHGTFANYADAETKRAEVLST
jgi:hypothetical protein